MYKESNFSDQINNMWIEKCTKKVIYLTKINNMWIEKRTKKVIYLIKLTICRQANVQRKYYI